MHIRFLSFWFLCWTYSSTLLGANRDSVRIERQIDAAIEAQEVNLDSAYALAKTVLSESKKLRFHWGVASAYVRMGSILQLQGENEEAISLLRQALQIRKEVKNWSGSAGITYLLAQSHYDLGFIDSSLHYLYEGVRLAEKAEDQTSIAQFYLKIAYNLMDYGDPKNSREYYEKAWSISTQLNDSFLTAFCHSGLGNYYLNTKRYNEAISHFRACAKLFEIMGATFHLAVANNNLAVVHDKMKNDEKALTHYRAALNCYRDMGAETEIASTMYNIGINLYNQKQYDSSLVYVNKALVYYTQNNDKQMLLESYELISDIYLKKGDYKTALEHQHTVTALKDSILNAEKVTRIAQMQTKYETEKKEQEIALLSEKNKTSAAQRKFLFAGTIALLLVLFVLGYYYMQRQKLAKQNELISKQKIATLLDEQEIKAYNAMLEGQEEERMRISTDLHDRLGSMLSTIKLMFSALGDKIDDSEEENTAQYQRATSLIDDACVEVRRISHNLGSGMVANFGLVKSLEELCESINQTRKLTCHFFTHQMDDGLPLHIEIEIYRIVQESINNIIKHARATKINIQLNKLEDEVNLHIEDNGVGFKVSEKKTKSNGLGLLSLENRASKIGGQLHIDSVPGKGTTILMEVPLTMDN